MNLWLFILLRSVIMLFVVLVLVRLMGKRQPSRGNAFAMVNYQVIAIVTALTSLAIINNMILGLTVLAVWVFVPMGLEYWAIKSKWVHDILNGKETILIKQGKIMEGNLWRARLTGEELLRELRSKNHFNLHNVEFAVMETSGDISVLPKGEYHPLTPHDLGQQVASGVEPQTVMLDGNILDEPLANLGLNREWLRTELEKKGVAPNNVFIAQADSSGDLYLDLFDDAVALPLPKVKEMLYATLLKIQADFMTYALETKDREAKEMYSASAARIKAILNKVKPYLLH